MARALLRVASDVMRFWEASLALLETHKGLRMGSHGESALLQAAKVMIRIRQATGSEVGTEQLFKAPTIAGLAAAIRGTNPDAEAVGAIPCADCGPEQRAEGVPCSANQAQMAVLFQMQPDSAAYNMSSAMRLLGRLDVGALEARSPPCMLLLSDTNRTGKREQF